MFLRAPGPPRMLILWICLKKVSEMALNLDSVEVTFLPFRRGLGFKIERVMAAVRVLDSLCSEEGVVLVHCDSGLVRTGTIICAYFILKYGMDVREVVGMFERAREVEGVFGRSRFLPEFFDCKFFIFFNFFKFFEIF